MLLVYGASEITISHTPLTPYADDNISRTENFHRVNPIRKCFDRPVYVIYNAAGVACEYNDGIYSREK